MIFFIIDIMRFGYYFIIILIFVSFIQKEVVIGIEFYLFIFVILLILCFWFARGCF